MSATLEDKLWQFALDVYGVEGVSAELLEVQNRCGADVCIGLTAAYAASHGSVPDVATLAAWDAAIKDWRRTVVRRLRAVRTAIKAEAATSSKVGGLRRVVLDAEVQAERLQLAKLAAHLRASVLSSIAHREERDRVIAAIANAMMLWTDEPVAMPRLVQASILQRL